jgi:mRNA interferase MazF
MQYRVTASRVTEPPEEGDVWLIRLGDAVGHEAKKTRPCLVVSASRFNLFGLATVCPITSRSREYPSFVPVEDILTAGLEVISYIQSEQVRTISSGRLIDRLGHVSPDVLASVRRNIKRHLSTP